MILSAALKACATFPISLPAKLIGNLNARNSRSTPNASLVVSTFEYPSPSPSSPMSTYVVKHAAVARIGLVTIINSIVAHTAISRARHENSISRTSDTR